MKKCNHCNIEKSFEHFYKNKNIKDGYDKRCKECNKIFANRYKNKPKEIPIAKKCSICNIEKSNLHFHKKCTSKDGLHHICKECRIPLTREYNNLNKEKVKKSIKKWRENNPNYKRNPHYCRERRSNDTLFKLNNNVRSLITQSLIRKNTIKSKKTTNILGCDLDYFKNYIEKQFLNWMTWDNMGNTCNNSYNCSWDLDHIIPMCSAKTEDEIYKLNHYSNFQPLCSKINRDVKKGQIPYICNIELNITTENGKIENI